VYTGNVLHWSHVTRETLRHANRVNDIINESEVVSTNVILGVLKYDFGVEMF
jgi:hypothetical protein